LSRKENPRSTLKTVKKKSLGGRGGRGGGRERMKKTANPPGKSDGILHRKFQTEEEDEDEEEGKGLGGGAGEVRGLGGDDVVEKEEGVRVEVERVEEEGEGLLSDTWLLRLALLSPLKLQHGHFP
jgi:hypothetical protein